MKVIFLVFVLAAQVLTQNPAFESIVLSRSSLPFSVFSFNVINPNNNPNPNIQTYVSPFTNSRIVYIPPTAFLTPTSGISTFLSNYSGKNGVPAILKLKDERRTIDGSNNNQKSVSINQAKTGLVRHAPPLYKDGIESPISTDFEPRVVSNALGIVKPIIER